MNHWSHERRGRFLNHSEINILNSKQLPFEKVYKAKFQI